MRKRLLLLELVLIAVSLLAGQRARQVWLDARRRDAAMFGQGSKAAPSVAPEASAPEELPPAGDYSNLTEQLLFSPDRNSTVVAEAAPVKIMPALPLTYGVINLGDGPAALLSAKAGGRQERVRIGDRFGEFKLLAASADSVRLEWDGREVVSRRRGGFQLASSGAASSFGPGIENGGFRACQPGDYSPAGSIADGYRKLVLHSPTGQVCRWAPLR